MASRKTSRKKIGTTKNRVLDARADTLDFRDRMYVPTLIEVPTHVPLERYRKHQVPILDQGQEGACTGFGLATVANYLLATRRVVPDCRPVSPRMLYEMARRYDEWPGENYDGASARGAMKGWHKHGVCRQDIWPHEPGKKGKRGGLNDARTADAVKRPLGAYFRVNHKDLVAMHAAIAEVGILYAAADVHVGWENPQGKGNKAGVIPFSRDVTGAHAFAIVAYDEKGFWIQNSWSKRWGKEGFACITYDDWLEHGLDVWVARLGAPIVLRSSAATAIAHSAGAGQSVSYSFTDLRPHVVSLGNEGQLRPGGDHGNTENEIEELFKSRIPEAIDANGYKHLLLYAHGGLVAEKTAVQRVADYRAAMLGAGVYPLSFIWHSDYWTTVRNILQDTFKRRRPEGVLDSSKDFMLDRLDDALEPLARVLSGKAAWDEMKENALAATRAKEGGARLVIGHLARLLKRHPQLKIHIAGHSAGSIFHAPFVEALARAKIPIESCTLWAPACTVKLFKECYMPAIANGAIRRFSMFVLSDQVEKDDHCANIYHKSLLYLVSNSFEDKPRIPLFRDGVPILGMEKFLRQDAALQKLFAGKKAELVIAPNSEPAASIDASSARTHGAFDDDRATLMSTLKRILADGAPAGTAAALDFHRSAGSLEGRRMQVDSAA